MTQLSMRSVRMEFIGGCIMLNKTNNFLRRGFIHFSSNNHPIKISSKVNKQFYQTHNFSLIGHTQQQLQMKHRKGKSTLSFKFLQNRFGTPLNTELQEPLNSDAQHKIDLLKLPVYGKKSKSKLASSIKSILPIKDKSKRQISTNQKTDNSQNILKAETQRYNYQRNNKSSNGNLLSRRTYNKTATQLKFKNKEDIQEKESDQSDQEENQNILQKINESSNIYEMKNAIKMKETNFLPHRQSLFKDSQSLLRKNSLYLSSFVKRKEKDGGERPHIAFIPNITGNMKIERSPRKSPLQLKEIKKQKKCKKNNPQTASKIFNNMPIDPW